MPAKSEQYVIVISSEDGESQAYGPFRNWQKADKIFNQIMEADGGNDEVRVQLLTLDRPKASELNAWVKLASRWREEEDDA